MNAHDHDVVNDIAGTIPSLTDDQAAWLIARIATEHRFVGLMFTPTDVKRTIVNCFEVDDITRPVTDADVEAVIGTATWRHSLEEHLSSEGHDIIVSIIEDVFDANGNIRPE